MEAIKAAQQGRVPKKDTRLASAVTEIERQTGGPDSLSTADSDLEALPPRATRPESKPTHGGSLLSDLMTASHEVVLAVLVAEKGK